MVTHVFDNSNLSQEIFAIDTWGAVICFFGTWSQAHAYDPSDYMETRLKADFLSSQKPLAASQQVLANSQNNFLSLHECDNLMNIGLAGLSNRDS